MDFSEKHNFLERNPIRADNKGKTQLFAEKIVVLF
jgi:hypothetical protein